MWAALWAENPDYSRLTRWHIWVFQSLGWQQTGLGLHSRPVAAFLSTTWELLVSLTSYTDMPPSGLQYIRLLPYFLNFYINISVTCFHVSNKIYELLTLYPHFLHLTVHSFVKIWQMLLSLLFLFTFFQSRFFWVITTYLLSGWPTVLEFYAVMLWLITRCLWKGCQKHISVVPLKMRLIKW